MSKVEAKSGSPPVFAGLVWALLGIVMWFWAIVGPLYLALGILSYFVDLRQHLHMPAEEAISLGAVLGAVGICSVWLRMRGYVRFVRE